jgi:CheY-like chemotaxis protein
MRPKILIVEDDHALRDVLRRGLHDEDFEPVLAADGGTALRPAIVGDRVADVDALGAQRAQDQRAEFVRADPTDPAHPVAGPGEADGDVGLGSRHGQAEAAA